MRPALFRISLVLASLLTLVPGASSAQDTLTDDVVSEPAQAEFVFDDVRHFLDAMAALDGQADTASILQTVYLDRATPGLLMFVEKYDLTTDRLIAAMREQPEAYNRLGTTLRALEEAMPEFHAAYADLKTTIPGAVFPPTYFVVAGHRGIGSGSVEGPLISIEKDDPSTLAVNLPPTLIHEMIHMQQLAALGPDYFVIFSGPERTLLATSIREGVATFFSELITGGSEHKNLARDFLLKHEKRLWMQFQQEMLGGDMGDWLWEDPANPEQPRDVGYAMGSRIARAYYEAATDKVAAAATILSVKDYPAFLEASGYGEKFE